MKPFLALSSAAVVLTALVSTAEARGQESQIVGTWHYDMRTLWIEMNPETKNFSATGQQAQDMIKKMTTSMTDRFGREAFKFGADRRVAVLLNGKETTLKGKWSLSGRKLVMTLEKSQETVPELTVDSTGKLIGAVYNYPNYGRVSLTLVR
jgi:hypothetical protein